MPIKSIFLITGMFTLLFISCSDAPGLEKYIVRHQDKEDFISLSLPADLFFQGNIEQMSEKTRQAFHSIKQVNLIALPLKSSSQAKVNSEIAQLDRIFSKSKFKELINLNVTGKNLHLMYVGSKNNIESVVIYGKDPNKGFGVVRLLGEKLSSKSLATMLFALKNNKLRFNSEALSDFDKAMDQAYKKENSQ